MENKDNSEFENNQYRSSETDHSNHPNEGAADSIYDHGQTDEFQAVDKTFSFNEAESEPANEYRENAESFVPPNIETTRVNSQVEKRKGKGFVKGFTSMVAAGVVGSVLTLAVLPHTDYLKNFSTNGDNPIVGSSQQTPVKTVSAQPTSTSNSSIADMVESLSKAIVGVENYQQQRSTDFFGNSTGSQSVDAGSGSGVIIQKNGGTAYIVTNNHVVEGASKLVISLYDGTKTDAELVGTDALTDLAVLKIDAKYVNATADFGDSSKLRPGDQVYAIGNPLGIDFSRTVTSGIISATSRTIPVSTSAGNYETNVIQTDAAINPGNSGGALINQQGQVIGINSLKISETGVEGMGFAIPSNDVIPIVNQLIQSGKIQRPYLGVGLADLDQVPAVYLQNLPDNVKKGAVVANVDPKSGAANAGFQPKDVIVSMNGTQITTSADLRKYLYTKVKAGDEIKFEVYRNGKLMTLTAKLTSTDTNNQ